MRQGADSSGPTAIRCGPIELARLDPLHVPPRPELTGTWSGQIQAFGLPVVVHVAAGPCGTTVGSLDSPTQNASQLYFTAAQASGDSLVFAIAYIGATFHGTLRNTAVIEGQFVQGGITSPLRLIRGESGAAVVRRPQDPVGPLPYRVVDVTIDNPSGRVTLAGTLTLPPGPGPHPAVVLLSGSGTQGRDGEIMGHRLGLVQADYFTRRGVAVLRTDDRGVGGSSGNTFRATLSDRAGDARATIVFLRARPEINPRAVGVVGHSEGGLVALLAAAESPDVAFVVLLATPGIPMAELRPLQAEAIARASGATEALIKAHAAFQRAMVEHVRTYTGDRVETRARMRHALDSIGAQLQGPERSAFDSVIASFGGGNLDRSIDAQLDVQLTPWFRDLLVFDPRPTLRTLRQPLLALVGEKDVQVPAMPTLAALRQAFARGNRDATAELVAGVNHLFQHAPTGRVDEYGLIEETMAPQVLRRVTDWIVARWPLPTGKP
jgi:uncharacterized protein